MSNITVIQGHHAIDTPDPLCDVPGRCICMPLQRARWDSLEEARIGIEDIPIEAGRAVWSSYDEEGLKKEPLLTTNEILEVIDRLKLKVEA